jgi:hypothetical protein
VFRWLARVGGAAGLSCLLCAPAAAAISSLSGAIPFQMDVGCAEHEICRFEGAREVWYGTNSSWRYGVFSNAVACNNGIFGDPTPSIPKRCYVRAVQDIATPPRLDTIEGVFNGDDLLTTEGGRYTLETVANGSRRRLVGPYAVSLLGKLAVPDAQVSTPSYFQFLITDTQSGPVSYNVFIAATAERCLIQRVRSATQTDASFGRIMEIYSLVADPSTAMLPLRSDTQRICTQDKGKLAFFFKPPSIDAFQVKVVTHDSWGNATDVTDLFIPTKPVYVVR